MAATTTTRSPGSGETWRTYNVGSSVLIVPSKIDVGGDSGESLWIGAAAADGASNPTVPPVGAFLSAYNGTTWDRVRGDTTNGLDVDVTRMPGVFAEDAAHAGGDLGIQALAVRRDTPTQDAGTAGDYSHLIVDDAGRVWMRDPPRPRSTWYDLVTQASAVAANDQLCDEVELTGMSLLAGGGGLLNNVVLFSNNLTPIFAALWLYQVNPTAAGTNAVHNQTDANNESSRPIGAVHFTQWITETDNMHSIGTYAGMPLMMGQGLPYQCLDGTNQTSLWGILATYTAVTPGATTDYNLMVTHTAGV